MTQKIEVPFVGPSYTERSKNLNGQRTVNWFLQYDPTGKKPVALYPTPGRELEAIFGDGPLRGIYGFGSLLLVISGSTAYSYDPQVGEASIATLGTLTTSNTPVEFTDNGVSAVVADGVKKYSWDGAATFAEIGDADWPACSHVDFLNQRVVFNHLGTGRIGWTDLAALTVGSLSFATAEAAPDGVVAVKVFEQRVWVLGEKVSEVFYDTGDPSRVLARYPGAVLDVGCAAPYSVAKSKYGLIWLAKGASGQGQVVLTQGFNHTYISTPALEYAIGQYGDISSARAYTYEEEGHEFYVINFPGADTTWAVDLSQLTAQPIPWHERSTYNIGRDLAECHCFFSGVHYVGDFRNGRLYKQGLNFSDDAGSLIRRVRDTQYAHADGLPVIFHRGELWLETGTAEQGQVEPQAMLQWSDDNGRNWSNESWEGLGEVGEFGKRVFWEQMGEAYTRIFRLTLADTQRTALVGGMFCEVDVGSY